MAEAHCAKCNKSMEAVSRRFRCAKCQSYFCPSCMDRFCFFCRGPVQEIAGAA